MLRNTEIFYTLILRKSCNIRHVGIHVSCHLCCLNDSWEQKPSKKASQRCFVLGNTTKPFELFQDQFKRLTQSRISFASELTSSHSLKHKNLASSGHYTALSKPSWPQKSLTRLSKA